MDAKTFASEKKNCKICNRKGGLIMPVRFALNPKDSNAPEISGNFTATHDGDFGIPLDSDTGYTLRALRQGCLYVYDPEGRDEIGRKHPWQGYYINSQGYYIPFPVPKGNHPIGSHGDESAVPCDPWASEMVARCISVVDPSIPRTIWLGFSDTQWTDDVLKENEKEKVRNRHMQKFDLRQWWGTGSHPNACRLDECDKHVMDMAAGVNRKAFEFSPAPIPRLRLAHDVETLATLTGVKLDYPVSTAQLAEIFKKIPLIKDPEQRAKAEALRGSPSTPKDSLLRAAERMLGAENKHKAAVVALNDPVGIVMDLSVYMDYRLGKYVNEDRQKKFEREITLAGVIKNIKLGVKENLKARARKFENEKYDRQGKQGGYASGSVDYDLVHYGAVGDSLVRKKRDDRPYTEDFEPLAEAAWNKTYGVKIDKTKMEAAKKAFEDDLEAFDKDHILPLAKGYVSWFKGKLFTASMECNHDPCDMYSGLSYATIVSLCLGSLQDKAPINEEIIMNQLNAGMLDETGKLDKTKVLSRALVWNQDSEAREMQAAIDQGVGGIDLKTQLKFWQGVLKQSGRAVKAVSRNSELVNAGHSILARLTAQVGGSVIRAANAVATAGPIPAGLVKMGYVAHLPIIRVQIADNIPEVSRYLTERHINDLPGTHLDLRLRSDDIAEAFEAKLRQAGGKETKFTAYIAFNEKALTQALQEAGDVGGAIQHNTRVTTNKTAALLQNQWAVKQLERSHELMYLHRGLGAKEMFDGVQVTERINKEVQGRLPAAASIVVGLLQVALQIKGGNELEKVMASGDKTKAGEAQLSFTALSFGTVNAMGSAMEAMAELKPSFARFSPQLFDKEKFWLKYGAKFFGIAGGAITAYLDFANAWKSWDNKQPGMMVLYGFSGIFNVAGMGLIVASMIPRYAVAAWLPGAGIVLFVLGFALSLLIGAIKDNDLQDWLGRCLFGTDSAAKFGSLEEELRVLKAIQG
ncbi:MAG: hypothetical protein FWD67_10390 [Betaproteobacteria bacterium]|nr:hypothetical protein [Betaproteobacteria bacterium]